MLARTVNIVVDIPLRTCVDGNEVSVVAILTTPVSMMLDEHTRAQVSSVYLRVVAVYG